MLISFNSGYLGLLCKAQLGRQEYDNALTLQKKGMNRQSYWTLENGNTQLVSEKLFDIANVLNTPLEKIIIGD